MNFTKFKWWKKSNKNQHVKVDKIIYKADGSVSYIKLESYIYSQEIVDFEKYIAELEYVSNRAVVVSAKEELNRLKNEYIKSLVSEFPQAYINDVLYVNYIVLSTLGDQRKVVNTQKYILSSGEVVNVPKSFVYYGELSQTSIDNFSDTQKQIYYSLMTKNLDGYIRSKYLELIFNDPNLTCDEFKKIIETPIYKNIISSLKEIYSDVHEDSVIEYLYILCKDCYKSVNGQRLYDNLGTNSDEFEQLFIEKFKIDYFENIPQDNRIYQNVEKYHYL